MNPSFSCRAKRVDVKKFPEFVAGQNCINCALYQGKPADKAGWCTAWAKKA